MNCVEFKGAIRAGLDDGAVRAHVRDCDDCLTFAVETEPDFLFRSIGHAEMTPPGGIDAFVDGVMQQVHLRAAERSLRPASRRVSPWLRWSAAAALTLGLMSASLVDFRGVVPAPANPSVTPTLLAALERPIIELYDSPGATIIEVPAGETSDIRLVMVFDESLAADL